VLAFVRAVIAAGIACLPLVALGSDPGIPVLVLGCALACVIYVIALRLTGELTRADIDRMREVLSRRFAWAAPR
jgi:hypothetical protein